MIDYTDLVTRLRDTANGDPRLVQAAAAIEALVKWQDEFKKNRKLVVAENARLREALAGLYGWGCTQEDTDTTELSGLLNEARAALGEGINTDELAGPGQDGWT